MKKHIFIKSLAAFVTVIGIISSSAIQAKQVNAVATDEYIDRVCQIARSEVGYKEKNSKANLGDPDANSGTKNFTKYAQAFDDLRKSGKCFYNGEKNGYAWCDVFVDWCFYTAYGYDHAKQFLYQPENSYGAGCSNSAKYYNNNGKLYKSGKPKKGDQVFLNGGTHTGLIVDVIKEKNVYTYIVVEGNAGKNTDRVVQNTYTGTSKFSSWGRPDYEYVNYESFFVVFYKEIKRKNCTAAEKKKYINKLREDDIKTTIISVGWELLDSDGVRGISNDEFVDRMYKALVGTSVDSNKKKHLLEEIKYMNRKTAFEEVAKSSACRDYLKKKGLLK